MQTDTSITASILRETPTSVWKAWPTLLLSLGTLGLCLHSPWWLSLRAAMSSPGLLLSPCTAVPQANLRSCVECLQASQGQPAQVCPPGPQPSKNLQIRCCRACSHPTGGYASSFTISASRLMWPHQPILAPFQEGFSCLEVTAAALCSPESKGDYFLKIAMSFPLSQSTWGTCGEHWWDKIWKSGR